MTMGERPAWTLLGPGCGLLAILAPVCGWVSIVAFSDDATGPGPMIFLLGGVVAVVSFLVALGVGIAALIKSRDIPKAKGVGMAAVALALAAVVSWCLEWALLFGALMDGGFRL